VWISICLCLCVSSSHVFSSSSCKYRTRYACILLLADKKSGNLGDTGISGILLLAWRCRAGTPLWSVVAYEEEDTCHMMRRTHANEEEDTCHMRRRIHAEEDMEYRF
jgi:hypothetical protein